jgi:AraC-like DNA-binding protein
MSRPLSIAHHIKALPPALKTMAAKGFAQAECLKGTGIHAADLLNPEYDGFTLEQEFAFHRRLLELSEDPLLGLDIGRNYTLETYGLFGYAFLSAPTLRHAMLVARNFGPLSFTLFDIYFDVHGREGAFSFAPRFPVPDDLLQYYVDRDVGAVRFAGEIALDMSFPVHKVGLMHGNTQDRRRYENYFGCEVEFAQERSVVYFDANILETPMPLRDAQTSSVCQQQCQQLLARLSRSSGFVDEVRALIVARPGYFPDIDYVAEKLRLSTRTLRRRLKDEGSSYQLVLDEVRYRLARDYLDDSDLLVEEIALLLGYSTPGNFSAAFKRWHGTAPREFRRRG